MVRLNHLKFYTAAFLGVICLIVLAMQVVSGRRIAEQPLRLGIIGDSGVDEYQANDQRGGDFHEVTLNWLEQLVRNRNVDVGEWGDYPEPRRSGYAYNWARSGATAASLIDAGQHTGLAAQVAAGDIDIVVIAIGSNDFAPYFDDGYEPVYSGAVSGEALTARITNIVANVTTAVDTIREAQPDIPIVMMLIPNWNLGPMIQTNSRFADLAGQQRVSDALAATNHALAEMAQARDIVVVDPMATYSQLLPRMVDGQMIVGDVAIDPFSVGDEPHHGILGDSIHGGTVLEGFLANAYIEAINIAANVSIQPLSDGEILANAGLAPR